MSGATREHAMLKVTATQNGDPTLFTLFGRRGGNTQISADEIDSLVSALYSFRAGQHRPGDNRMIERKPVDNIIGRGATRIAGKSREIPGVKSNTAQAAKPGAEMLKVHDIVREPEQAVTNTGEGVIAATAPKPKKLRASRKKLPVTI